MAGFVGDEIVRKLEEMGVKSDFYQDPGRRFQNQPEAEIH